MEAVSSYFRFERFKRVILLMFPIIFVIAFEVLMIFSVGQTVTRTGLIIFLLQFSTYCISLSWGFPELVERKKYLQFLLKLSVIIISYILMRALVVLRAPWTVRFWEQIFSNEQLFFAFIHLFLILGTSFFVGFFRQSQLNAIKKEAALKERVIAIEEKRKLENIFYQKQLNPHFIFNILTAIKQETKNQLPDVSKAVELLALLQKNYLIDPVKNQKIRLTSEIEALQCYCELESFLKPRNTFVNLKIEINDSDLQLPLGIIVTLAENVYRYGLINESDNPGIIEANLIDTKFYLHTWNSKRRSIIKGHGLGQKNVKALLDHHYPGHYSLTVNDTDEYYELKLQIDL